MTHKTTITVRGYHLDLYQHVNNARYLEFLEEARWEMFENNIDRQAWHDKKLGLSIVNININYRAPAVMGSRLTIVTELQRIGNKSITLNQAVCINETDIIAADAAVTFVVTDMRTGKALNLEGWLRKEIEKLFN